MARLSIVDAAHRLGLSADAIRRRVRKGEMQASRDNHGKWWVEIADDAAPMRPAKPVQGGASLAPMPEPDPALVDALRANLADLCARLDRSEAERREDRAAWDAERARLLLLLQALAPRPPFVTMQALRDMLARLFRRDEGS
ncbi:MAG: hypothetical protein NVS2B11_13270 [Acetobacteraceae bacterium]